MLVFLNPSFTFSHPCVDQSLPLAQRNSIIIDRVPDLFVKQEGTVIPNLFRIGEYEPSCRVRSEPHGKVWIIRQEGP